MIIRKISSVAICMLCSGQLFSADTIVLTNGEKIDGRVVREEGDNLVLEVNITASIKDEVVIPKADVRFIEKEKEDVKAFNEVAQLYPTPPLLPEKAYEQRIELINGFIEAFPESTLVSKAKELVELLAEELGVVKQGGIKLNDEMILPKDYAANAYEYDSVIAAKRIDDAITRGELLVALRMFEKYEETFADSAGRTVLAARIRQVLAAYGARIDSSTASFESRMEAREAGLETMTLEDRGRAERAIENEQKLLEERYQKQKQSNDSWITPDANHLDSLKEARRQVDRELSRLESTSRIDSPEQPLAEAYRNAWITLGKEIEDENEVKAIFAGLKNLRMPENYIEMLRERAEADKTLEQPEDEVEEEPEDGVDATPAGDEDEVEAETEKAED